jgi:hypothetical protein
MIRVPLLAVAFLALPTVALGADPKDWPSYNGGAAGWRCNAGETTLGKANVDKLEEKWRFPAKGSALRIGSVHATPVVVDGEVYFGTATQPTFYKLAEVVVHAAGSRRRSGVAVAQGRAIARHLRLGTGHRRRRVLRRLGGLALRPGSQ